MRHQKEGVWDDSASGLGGGESHRQRRSRHLGVRKPWVNGGCRGCLRDTQVEHSHWLHRSGPLPGVGYLELKLYTVVNMSMRCMVLERTPRECLRVEMARE